MTTIPNLPFVTSILAAKRHPKVVATIARSLLQLAGESRHSVRPFGDRMIDLVIQVGKLGESFQVAMSDGVLSDDERKELRVWINRAEYVLDGMKRSLGEEPSR